MYPTPLSCLLWIASWMSLRVVYSPFIRRPVYPSPYNSAMGGSLRCGLLFLLAFIICLPEHLNLLHHLLAPLLYRGALLSEVLLHMLRILVDDRRHQSQVHAQVEDRPRYCLHLLPLIRHDRLPYGTWVLLSLSVCVRRDDHIKPASGCQLILLLRNHAVG